MSDPRAFENPFNDEKFEMKDEEFKTKCKETKEKLLASILETGIKESRGDISVYTGISGIAFLLAKVGQKEHAIQLLEDAIRLKSRKSPRITFLCGISGPLAILTVLKNSENYLRELLSLKKYLKDNPDELLYGKVGYLYALLYVQKVFKNEAIETAIEETFEMIITEGRKEAKECKSRSPLMFQWHEKHYYGAAHGLIGILFVLLQAGDKYLSYPEIKSSIDYIKVHHNSCFENLLQKFWAIFILWHFLILLSEFWGHFGHFSVNLWSQIEF